jgi:hypothetical protein
MGYMKGWLAAQEAKLCWGPLITETGLNLEITFLFYLPANHLTTAGK